MGNSMRTRDLLPSFGSRNFRKLSMLLVAVALSWSGFPHLQVHGFTPHRAVVTPRQSLIRPSSRPSTCISRLSNNNNDGNDNNNKINFNSIIDFDLLLRRFERADKVEIRNDASLVACYVLCRFLVYDITSGAKIEPGWNIQDFIWLTGTFSSATVLVVYYTIAGLLSQSFQQQYLLNRSWSSIGENSSEDDDSSESDDDFPSSTIRALVNVVLCCPVWLATEHLLGFGPPDIGGNTLSVSVATGFIGFGSFMALVKTLTVRMK